MATEIVIPRLGWSMDEGTFVEWLKKDGDVVAIGDFLFSLESEKAIQEIEATDAGILRIPPDGAKDGDVLSVGTVVAYLVHQGEEFEIADFGLRIADSSPGATPVATYIKPKSEIRNPKTHVSISPRARRLAAGLGVEWTTIPGTGRNGRIRESDVRAAANPQSAIRDPQSNLRRTIADRLAVSRDNTVPVTLTTTLDATQLVELRNQFRRSPDAFDGLVPSYTDLIGKIVSAALQQHPAMNSRWSDDGAVTMTSVHLGIAVDTDDGLLVPVLRDAESLSLRTLSRASKELVRRARARSLAAEELQGGTFTITNLGAYGIDAFTPVVNSPECAILGIGAIGKRPAVVDGAIVPRETVTLSLTFDHRIVDGAPAAKFLQTVRKRLEDPAPWLMP